MKLSKPLWALTLIASALLLSGAKNVCAETPGQPNQGSQTQAEPQQHSSISSPPVSTFVQPSPAPSAQGRRAETENQTHNAGPNANDFPARLEAIATILLVGFAGWQMRFIRRSTTATENAANAASDNAKAAKNAAVATERYVEMTKEMVEVTKQNAQAAIASLDINRPFLFVTSIRMEPPELPMSRLFAITIVVENYGTGPADVRDFIVEAAVLDWPEDRPFATILTGAVADPPAWHPPDEGARLQNPLIRAGEKIGDRFQAVVELSPEDLQSMVNTEKKLRVEGRIRYWGASRREYVTKFYWWFIVEDMTGRVGAWVRSLNPEFNDYT